MSARPQPGRGGVAALRVLLAPLLSRLRPALVLVQLLVLAGCTAMAPPARISQDAGFALEGRVAVRYGAENISGRIAWTHDPARDEIGLASPLGNQLARLVRAADGVTLTDSRQETFRAADAESLTEQRLGWRLPLSGLTDWVQGRVATGLAAGTIADQAAPEAQRDNAGRLSLLMQSGWRIDYSYEDDTARLPKRLILQYLKAVEPLEIRLVIERWL